MPTLNPFPNRYRPLQTSLTDTTPLIIDTEANPQDILESALQRIRASSDLRNDADAQHLIETLEEHFTIDFVDFDNYRYFQPDGYDVFLKRKAKGRGEKVPLTIGMLYRAIKAQRWDTQELEEL